MKPNDWRRSSERASTPAFILEVLMDQDIVRMASRQGCSGFSSQLKVVCTEIVGQDPIWY